MVALVGAGLAVLSAAGQWDSPAWVMATQPSAGFFADVSLRS